MSAVTTTTNNKDDELFSPDRETRDNIYRPLSPSAYDAVSTGGGGGETPVYEDPAERERQEKEWHEELIKVEGEILTLRQVLTAKVRQATELKRKLGITPMQEFKQDLQAGLQQLRDSGTYQKTSTVMKSASEKTASALSTVGASLSKKFGDLRNSQTFKNVEEKVETAYANVKGATGYFLGSATTPTESRVKGSRSDNSIDEAFQAASAPTTPRSEDNPPLPEEKVPL